MNATATIPTFANLPSLRSRLQKVGVPLFTCGNEGLLSASDPADGTWIEQLLTRGRLLVQQLPSLTAAWNEETEPAEVEVFPGLWLVPMGLRNRRERTGYVVAVLISDEFERSEQLAALCQSAEMDVQLCRGTIAKLPPISGADVPRLAQMVRYVFDDASREQAGEMAMHSISQQLAESYEEISLLYKITQSITDVEQPDRFVQIVCDELLGTLSYAWIGALMSPDREKLKRLAGTLTIAGDLPTSKRIIRPLMEGMLAEAVPDAPMVLEPTRNPKHACYQALGETVLVHPIGHEGEVIGIFVAGEKQGPDTHASSGDMKLLGATASHTAIFLENSALYEDLNAMFLGTLEALTASIDAKDRYTCGHSQRVAQLTQQLAAAIRLDEYTVGRVRIAGLVHDVGKIGVPEHVLTKPGKLTEEEFAEIRKHPEIGYRILRDIPRLHDVLDGVLYHHERWDGHGYPHGLQGQEIPLVARLIGLADSFDAMSSTRTYRSAMSRTQVLTEIMRCSGRQFDPTLAPVFVKLDFSEYDRLVIEHRANEAIVPQFRGDAA